MRLVAVVKQPTTADMTWNVIDQAIWATVEADFAIISGKPIQSPSLSSLDSY